MKLAEAASVLGISLEEVTTDSLKQQYRRLIMSWDPDTVRDAQAKAKYSQITEAYKRLSSVMEGKDNFRPEDQHDVAAFMRIFMDMMGMSSEHDIPHAAAMTFSMMFGSHQNGNEEYSTDEDGDGSYYDDDEEEEEEDEDYVGDEDDEDRSFAPCDNSWEPQAKVYSNMNLKKDVVESHSDAETMLKKLKQAKKRAEKRKKQKERRNKEKEINEVSNKELEMEEIDVESASPELLEQLITYHQNRARDHLIKSIDDGCSDSLEPLIMCSFQETLSPIIANEVVSGFKAMLPTLNLFHRCITDFTDFRHLIENESSLPEQLRTLSHNRVQIAEKLFESVDPMLDFTAVDENGLSVLHHSIVLYDVNYTNFVVRTISNSQNLNRKMSLNLNTRCQKKGWAPIHYAVEKANIPSIRLLAQAGANLQASSATDKRMVPIELAKARIKSNQSNAALKETAERVLSLLMELIAWQKNAAKEAEKQKKGESGIDTSTKTPSKSSSANQNAAKANSTPEKKEEKKEPASVTKTTDKKKKGKNDGKKKEEVSSETKQSKPIAKEVQASTPVPSIQPSSAGVTINSGAIISLASHDEMVDNLLAMGFQESDCLQAIQLYGTDLDNAISWLCERPPVETKKRDEPPPPPPTVNSRNSLVGMTKPLNPLPKKSSSSGDLSATAAAPVPTIPPTASSNQPPAAATQPPTIPTRTTSKGWNIKEEDKKVKIDANHTPIIPMSEFVSLPPPSHSSKTAQKTPEPSKKAGKNRANHTPSPNVANKVTKTPSPAVFSPTAHQGLPPAANSFPPLNADLLAAQTPTPLSTSAESSFLPSFTSSLAQTQGSMGLGFGGFGTDPIFDLSGGIGGFGTSFVSGSSLLNTMGSASSDHDLDYSIPAAGGAIELSAGAKPFIPKSFTPIANPQSILSATSSAQVIPPTDFSFTATDSTTSLVGSAFGTSMSSMDDPLHLLGQSAGSSLWSSSTVGLGIASSSGLGGLSSLGRQGDLPDYLSGILGGPSEPLDLGLDPNDMMPDLDSLLPTDF